MALLLNTDQERALFKWFTGQLTVDDADLSVCNDLAAVVIERKGIMDAVTARTAKPLFRGNR